MTGSAQQLRPGYWRLRVYVGQDPVTKRSRYRSRCVKAPSRRAAERFLPAFVVEVQNGAQLASSGTFAHLCESVLAHMTTRDREATTLDGYQNIVRQALGHLGAARLDFLRPSHLNAYYDHLRALGRSPGTIHNHHRFIHRALALAVQWEWLERNPADRADPPPVYRQRRPAPSAESVRRLIELARKENESLGTALLLAAALGCRRGELCGLQWGDVDTHAHRVTIRRAVKQVPGRLVVADTKTHSERAITIGNAGVMHALFEHLTRMDARALWATGKMIRMKEEAFIFSDAADCSTPWRPDKLTHAVVKLRDAAGYTGRLHDLRHWNVSALLDAGEDVTVVAARSGHRDPSTTHNVYAHMLPAGDQRAAEILDRELFG